MWCHQMGRRGVFSILERPGNGKPGIGRAAAALICVALAAGCGSSSSSPATSASSASSSSPAAAPSSTAAVTAPSTPLSPAATGTSGPSPCATSGLKVTLGAAGGYAGGVIQAIVFTNTSGTTCTLYGYPGVSFVSAPPYTQIGLAAKRGGTTPVTLVTLAPGVSANAMLQIVDALNFPPATCNPAKAAYLRIYPPNQTVPVYLANTSETCAQPVQTLTISAVQAGSGSTS
jgi:Protein of unknown function (DUF4232)